MVSECLSYIHSGDQKHLQFLQPCELSSEKKNEYLQEKLAQPRVLASSKPMSQLSQKIILNIQFSVIDKELSIHRKPMFNKNALHSNLFPEKLYYAESRQHSRWKDLCDLPPPSPLHHTHTLSA